MDEGEPSAVGRLISRPLGSTASGTSETEVVHHITHILMRFPKLAGLVGLLAAALFCLLAAYALSSLVVLPVETVTLTMSQLPASLQTQEAAWVEITDGNWDCATLSPITVGENMQTEVFLRSPDGSIALLVNFPGERPCQSLGLPVGGMAYPMSNRHLAILQEQGRVSSTNEGTPFLQLCTTCSRRSSFMLIIVSLAIAFLGLLLYPLTLMGKRALQALEPVRQEDNTRAA